MHLVGVLLNVVLARKQHSYAAIVSDTVALLRFGESKEATRLVPTVLYKTSQQRCTFVVTTLASVDQ